MTYREKGVAGMKKVVFVSTVFPFPVDNGKRIVVWGILKYLIEKYGAEQVTYVLLGGRREASSASVLPCRYRALEKPNALRRIWNIFWFTLIKRAKSIQELMLYSPEVDRKLRDIVSETDPDVVVCDTFRAGQFFESPGRFSKSSYILYMDDLFSVRYQKMLGILERFPRARLNPLGNFEHFVPSPLKPVANTRFVQKRLLKMEQKLVEKRERDCVVWFDKTLLINKSEADMLRKETGQSSIKTVKPFITGIRYEADRSYTGEPVFVFLGALNIPHNRFSITHFVESQMATIKEQIPGARLRIVGRGGSNELKKLAGRYGDSVTVEGFIEDLDAVFRESCAMIVPLLFGSGVKIKTLEALSRGLPVISTDFGMEGISATDGVHCRIENNLDRYPQLMLDLTDPHYNRTISCGARKFYIENYSTQRVFKEYDLLFRRTAT